MLHQDHTSTAKMDQLAEAFWWPGMHREIQEKAETCPSCRAAGKNIITQIPSTEKHILEILTEPNRTEPNRTEPGNPIGFRWSNQIKDAQRCIQIGDS